MFCASVGAIEQSCVINRDACFQRGDGSDGGDGGDGGDGNASLVSTLSFKGAHYSVIPLQGSNTLER